MWRRRQAAQRMEPLNCPGRCRDPLFCRCHPPLSDRARRTRSSEHDVLLSERWIDAGADAARHILRIGLVPMLEPGTLRALHKRGGRDRELARRLWELVA